MILCLFVELEEDVDTETFITSIKHLFNHSVKDIYDSTHILVNEDDTLRGIAENLERMGL